MPFINNKKKEITCKIVYYGPGLSGKTTNIKDIHRRANPATRGDIISLETDTERTLFFDYMPLSLGKIRGYNIRLQLFTTPGQIFYQASRKLILKGVDGIVFVADSQEMRLASNEECWEDMLANLDEYGYRFEEIPTVIQYNKRDLPTALPVAELRAILNPNGLKDFSAIATKGIGTQETLKAVARMVLLKLKSGG